MTRIKRQRNVEKHKKIKHRHHKPNIPELVYKYLIANEAFDDAERHLLSKCRYCGQEKHDEVVDFTSKTIDRDMGYRVRKGQRKNNGRISKLHNIKQHPISKDLPTSYLQKYANGKDTKKAKKYMKKALDFGVESGYLIPFDPTYKILRVSSNLMKSDSRRSKSICDMAFSKNIPTRLEDFQVQEQKRSQKRRGRRRQGRRSRSGSRMRRRSRRRRSRRSRSCSRGRRRSPQNPEEVAEDKADDYEIDENDPKSNIHTDDIERERKTVRSNQPERPVKKAEEDGSDLSIDEDETDDENEKKGTDITKKS